MTAFLLTIGIGVLLGVAQSVHDRWFDNTWVDTANRLAAEDGGHTLSH